MSTENNHGSTLRNEEEIIHVAATLLPHKRGVYLQKPCAGGPAMLAHIKCLFEPHQPLTKDSSDAEDEKSD